MPRPRTSAAMSLWAHRYSSCPRPDRWCVACSDGKQQAVSSSVETILQAQIVQGAARLQCLWDDDTCSFGGTACTPSCLISVAHRWRWPLCHTIPKRVLCHSPVNLDCTSHAQLVGNVLPGLFPHTRRREVLGTEIVAAVCIGMSYQVGGYSNCAQLLGHAREQLLASTRCKGPLHC